MGNKNEATNNSLIPIKGISQAQKKALNTKCQIYDITGLLVQGRTPSQRAEIANKLGINKSYVNLWVKQADLWRVLGMTADYAYLLVLAGIRCVNDLAKVNVEKAKVLLQSISSNHPGFEWDSEVLVGLVLNATIMEASSLSKTYLEYKISDVSDSLSKNIGQCVGSTGDPNMDQNELDPNFSVGPNPTEDSLKNIISAIINGNRTQQTSSYDTTLDVSDDPEPTYLFDKEIDDEILGKSESEIIEEGLAFLQDITVALPLPHYISGVVKYRSESQKASEAKSNSKVADLLVEISGIVNPSAEATEGKSAISAYTDGTGRFCLVMPDKYSMEDSITFTFSYGSYKQTFVKQASEIIDNTTIRNGAKDENGKPLTAQTVLGYFDELDSINKQIKQQDRERELLQKIEDNENKKNALADKLADEKDAIREKEIQDQIDSVDKELDRLASLKNEAGITASLKDTKEAIEGKKRTRTKLISKIYGSDPTTNDLEKTLTNLMSRTDLESCFDGDELDPNCTNKCFVIIEEVFKNYRDQKPRALPSVRLMGEGDDATWLPTDSAPSRTYSYTMLQRLVEPAIYPPVGATMENGRQQRMKMTSPVDVDGFKNKVMTDPDSIPKMASLGVGYVLNMHQAWVPDGFALGTLLYSLILAPGEEQRLIVREHNESYQIMDTFEGTDETSESTSRTQSDDIQALYDYMLNQESTASSSSRYKSSSWSIGGSASGGYGGFSLGLSGGYSKSSGSSSTSSRQTNNHSESSQAAQSFNQQFSTAANMLAKAKRVSIRTASSSESESVATKIIANHNHSHAMTVQYWEVVRRYRLETSIDGVDLVLFVPLDLIKFLPTKTLQCSFDNIPTQFYDRYSTLIRHYSTLRPALPYKYRRGLDLIQRYASLPKWTIENKASENQTLRVTIYAKLYEFDSITTTLFLRNGMGTVAGSVQFTPQKLRSTITTLAELKEEIAKIRMEKPTRTQADCVTLDFTLPYGATLDDISNITIYHSCRDFKYDLYLDATSKEYYDNWGEKIKLDEVIEEYWNYRYDVMKDQKKTVEDSGKMQYYLDQIPEAYISPIATLKGGEILRTAEVLYDLGSSSNDTEIDITHSSTGFMYNAYLYVNPKVVHMRYTEFQKMEETLQHIASETIKYSQRVWQTLSSNELAMMLEKYNIDMNFKTYFDVEDTNTYVPLLNCVNVRRRMGYYGNCVLLPFTYPEELSKKLGKTAGEIQDALYRYHTSCFRAPTTTISIPTDGMVGEAVLGATNVSEEIDLTRFWNWKDSPIDSMTLDSSYLSSGDYLGNKTTKDFSALNLQTATQQTPVTSADLISALVAKQTPQFENITGLEQTASLLNNAMNTTSTGRDNVINQSTSLANKAMDYAQEKLKAESAERVAKINKGISTDDSKPDSEGNGSEEKPNEQKPEGKTPEGDKPETDNDAGKKPEGSSDDAKSDKLKNIIDEAIGVIGKKSPTDFYNDTTGSSLDGDAIKQKAAEFCSSKGSDLESVLGSILGKN